MSQVGVVKLIAGHLSFGAIASRRALFLLDSVFFFCCEALVSFEHTLAYFLSSREIGPGAIVVFWNALDSAVRPAVSVRASALSKNWALPMRRRKMSFFEAELETEFEEVPDFSENCAEMLSGDHLRLVVVSGETTMFHEIGLPRAPRPHRAPAWKFKLDPLGQINARFEHFLCSIGYFSGKTALSTLNASFPEKKSTVRRKCRISSVWRTMRRKCLTTRVRAFFTHRRSWTISAPAASCGTVPRGLRG